MLSFHVRPLERRLTGMIVVDDESMTYANRLRPYSEVGEQHIFHERRHSYEFSIVVRR